MDDGGAPSAIRVMTRVTRVSWSVFSALEPKIQFLLRSNSTPSRTERISKCLPEHGRSHERAMWMNIFPLGPASPNFGLFVKLNCVLLTPAFARRTSQIQYWKRISILRSSRHQLKSKWSTGSMGRPLTSQQSSLALECRQPIRKWRIDIIPDVKRAATEAFSAYPTHVGGATCLLELAILHPRHEEFRPAFILFDICVQVM